MRKSIRSAAAMISAALCSCTFTSVSESSAASSEDADFLYSIINGKATITGFTGEPVFLDIPETVEDVPVTELRDNAFFNCTSLKHISLPSSVKKIGNHTFFDCSSLESISLPDGLEEIGMGAFSGCTNLSSIDIPDSLASLPESCFRYCSSLSEVIIPEGISEIGSFCFNGCGSLSYVSIIGELSRIDVGAFYGCTALREMYIPPSVSEIGYEAIGYITGKSGAAVSSNFTLLGEENSSAEKYASENGMNFSPITISSANKSSASGIPDYLVPMLFSLGGAAFLVACFIALRTRFPDVFRLSRKKEKSFDFPVDKNQKI